MVLGGQTDKQNVQVLRGLDLLSIDVSETTGDCEMIVVGEYYVYSKAFWESARVSGMAVSLAFFFGGFLLNFMYVGVVKITPF